MSIERKIREMDTSLIIGSADFFSGVDFAKHRAAQIAKEADELMAEMASALRVAAMSDDPDIKPDARSAVLKYNAWKERSK